MQSVAQQQHGAGERLRIVAEDLFRAAGRNEAERFFVRRIDQCPACTRAAIKLAVDGRGRGKHGRIDKVEFDEAAEPFEEFQAGAHDTGIVVQGGGEDDEMEFVFHGPVSKGMQRYDKIITFAGYYRDSGSSPE